MSVARYSIISPNEDVIQKELHSDRSPRTSAESFDPDFSKRFSSISETFDLEKQNSFKRLRSSVVSREKSSDSPEDDFKTISSKLWSTTRSWKIRDLYVELLCILFPSAEARQKPDSRSLISFLQKIFRIDQEEHLEVVEIANQTKRVDEWVLHLEVIEAKGLPPMDVNGLSDPFCTLSLSERKDLSYRTVVQPKTLQPVWNAMFTFPVTSYENDVLVINVWDYDPEEKTMNKFKRISVIKSAKAWKQYLRDLTSGNETQEFMGKVTVDIKDVQPELIDKWFPLENEGNQGEIRLRMALATNKDKLEAMDHYKQIYQLLLIFDLERGGTNIKPFVWNGTFPKDNWTTYILQRMLWNGGLKPYQTHVAEWLALTRVHLEFPLDISLFSSLLQKIFHSLKNNSLFIKSDEYANFWKSLNQIMQNFALQVSRDFVVEDDTSYKNIKLMLETASQVRIFASKEENRDYINQCLSEAHLQEKFSNAVTERAVGIFEGLAKVKSGSSDTISSLATLCTLLQSDLDESIRQFQHHFQTCIGLNFYDLTYIVYDSKIARLVEPVVEQACTLLTEIGSIDLCNEDEETREHNEMYIQMATSLFKLHVSVKRFSIMSKKLEEKVELRMYGFYQNWFRPCVFHWWECAGKNVAQCLKKALESEKTREKEFSVSKILHVPVSSFVSQSAPIFEEIQIIWKELDMPNNEESYDLILDIVNKLCKCTLQYAETISKEIDVSPARKSVSDTSERYAIPKKVCVSLNNIQHVTEAGLSAVLKWISPRQGLRFGGSKKKNSNKYSKGAQKIIDIAEDCLQKMNEEILRIFQKCSQNIRAEMCMLIEEVCYSNKKVQSGENEYIWYSDINLSILKYDLTPSTFNMIVVVWWKENLGVIEDLLLLGKNSQKESEYFTRLHETFLVLRNLFQGNRAAENDSSGSNAKFVALCHQSAEKESEVDKSLRKLYKSTL